MNDQTVERAYMRAGEIVQQVRVLAGLTEGPSSIPRTYTVVHNHP